MTQAKSKSPTPLQKVMHGLVLEESEKFKGCSEEFRATIANIQKAGLYYLLSAETPVYKGLVRDFFVNIRGTVSETSMELRSSVNHVDFVVNPEMVGRLLRLSTEGCEDLPPVNVPLEDAQRMGYVAPADIKKSGVDRKGFPFRARFLMDICKRGILTQDFATNEASRDVLSLMLAIYFEEKMNWSQVIFSLIRGHFTKKKIPKNLPFGRLISLLIRGTFGEDFVANVQMVKLERKLLAPELEASWLKEASRRVIQSSGAEQSTEAEQTAEPVQAASEEKKLDMKEGELRKKKRTSRKRALFTQSVVLSSESEGAQVREGEDQERVISSVVIAPSEGIQGEDVDLEEESSEDRVPLSSIINPPVLPQSGLALFKAKQEKGQRDALEAFKGKAEAMKFRPLTAVVQEQSISGSDVLVPTTSSLTKLVSVSPVFLEVDPDQTVMSVVHDLEGEGNQTPAPTKIDLNLVSDLAAARGALNSLAVGSHLFRAYFQSLKAVLLLNHPGLNSEIAKMEEDAAASCAIPTSNQWKDMVPILDEHLKEANKISDALSADIANVGVSPRAQGTEDAAPLIDLGSSGKSVGSEEEVIQPEGEEAQTTEQVPLRSEERSSEKATESEVEVTRSEVEVTKPSEASDVLVEAQAVVQMGSSEAGLEKKTLDPLSGEAKMTSFEVLSEEQTDAQMEVVKTDISVEDYTVHVPSSDADVGPIVLAQVSEDDQTASASVVSEVSKGKSIVPEDAQMIEAVTEAISDSDDEVQAAEEVAKKLAEEVQQDTGLTQAAIYALSNPDHTASLPGPSGTASEEVLEEDSLRLTVGRVEGEEGGEQSDDSLFAGSPAHSEGVSVQGLQSDKTGQKRKFEGEGKEGPSKRHKGSEELLIVNIEDVSGDEIDEAEKEKLVMPADSEVTPGHIRQQIKESADDILSEFNICQRILIKEQAESLKPFEKTLMNLKTALEEHISNQTFVHTKLWESFDKVVDGFKKHTNSQRQLMDDNFLQVSNDQKDLKEGITKSVAKLTTDLVNASDRQVHLLEELIFKANKPLYDAVKKGEEVRGGGSKVGSGGDFSEPGPGEDYHHPAKNHYNYPISVLKNLDVAEDPMFQAALKMLSEPMRAQYEKLRKEREYAIRKWKERKLGGRPKGTKDRDWAETLTEVVVPSEYLPHPIWLYPFPHFRGTHIRASLPAPAPWPPSTNASEIERRERDEAAEKERLRLRREDRTSRR